MLVCGGWAPLQAVVPGVTAATLPATWPAGWQRPAWCGLRSCEGDGDECNDAEACCDVGESLLLCRLRTSSAADSDQSVAAVCGE